MHITRRGRPVAVLLSEAEYARLSRIGRTPLYADTQIAAIAAVNGLVLVSRDAHDFREFAGLIVENWFDRSAEAGP